MHTQYKPATSNQPSIQQLAIAGTTATQPTTNHIPVAFVEFRDVQSAGQAMRAMQGKYLLSSDRGAIRIEYAKSKMAHEQLYHHHAMTMQSNASAIINGNGWQN